MWKSTIMISFDYGNKQELRKKCVDKLGSTIPKHRICQTYIYIYIHLAKMKPIIAIILRIIIILPWMEYIRVCLCG